MKLTKISLGLALAAGLALAGSSTYKVTIPSNTWAGDTQLKAGDYKVQVENNQATFMHGKDAAVHIAASVEQNAKKSPDTLLETSGDKLQAIDIGGSTVKIVIKNAKTGTQKAQ